MSETHEREFVCAGKVRLAGGALGVTLIELDAAGQLGQERHFQNKNSMRTMRPGVVYAIRTETQPDGLRIFASECRFVRLWPDAQQRAVWQAESEAEEVAHRAKKMRLDDMTALLAPIRKQYQRTDSIGRLALQVVLLDALRKKGGE